MIRTIIYARVSTEDQVERYGIPIQLRACREYAKRNGLTVADEIVDEGISGSLLERPGLRRVRDTVAKLEADAVVMLDVDRLSRELAHLLILKPELEKHARLEFVSAKFEATPSGNLFFQMRGVIGNYERALTRERTMRGQMERARSGLIIGGRTTYGYRYENGSFVVDEPRAAVIRSIFADYERGVSMRAITDQLRQSGTPTWRSSEWQKSSVAFILHNSVYSGTMTWNKTVQGDGRRVSRSQSEHVSIPVPALVSTEQWKRVQARLAENPSVGRPSLCLLRGVLFCHCGRKMGGESRRNGRYRCDGRDRLRFGSACRESAPVAALDKGIWGEIARAFQDADFLRDQLVRYRSELNRETAGVEEIRRRVAKLKRQEQNAMALMFDADMAEERVQLKAKYKGVTAELRKAEAELVAAEGPRDAGDWLEASIDAIKSYVASVADAKEKQEFARNLIDRAEWDGENVTLNCFIVPESSNTLRRNGRFTPLYFQLFAKVAA